MSEAQPPTPHIAYVINKYPLVTQTFIRREIQALERLGFTVERISVQGGDHELVSDDDRRESALTRYVVKRGWIPLIAGLARTAASEPRNMARAVGRTVRLGWGTGRGPLVFIAYLAQACTVARWVRHAGVQHIHAHFGNNSTDVAALASALTGIPFSFTVHGPWEFDRPESIALTQKIPVAAFAVTISSFGRSQLYRWADRADWSKIHIVRCGVDAEFRDVSVTDPPDNREFVCVGRYSEQKGQLLLLDAIAEIRRRGGQCHVTLIGDGEMRQALEERIAEHGLEGWVTLAGSQPGETVRRAMQGSRALLLPSFAEGLPVVLMEAMALGRPALTTYVAGIPELVVEGESGWLFPAGSVAAIADAIEACLSATPEQLAEMGTNARGAVLKQHDSDTEAGTLAALIRESVDGSRAPEPGAEPQSSTV